MKILTRWVQTQAEILIAVTFGFVPGFENFKRCYRVMYVMYKRDLFKRDEISRTQNHCPALKSGKLIGHFSSL